MLLQALLLRKKLLLQQKRDLQNFFYRWNDVPPSLFNPLKRNTENKKEEIQSFIQFLYDNNTYSMKSDENSKRLLYYSGLSQKKQRHYDIHTICVAESFPALIGMDVDCFTKLFCHLESALCTTFPHSPVIVNTSSDICGDYCSVRMKLFLTLFRLKNACSFYFMSGLFGWSPGALQRWYDLTIIAMYERMREY